MMCFGGTASSRKSRGTGVRNTEIEWLEPLNSPIKNSRIPYHVFRFFFLSTVGGIKNIGGISQGGSGIGRFSPFSTH